MNVFKMTGKSSVTPEELGEFFSRNVTTDYISHGEVFCGRARSLQEWVPDLQEVVAAEIREAILDDENKQIWVGMEDSTIVGLSIVSIQSPEVATFDDMVVLQGKRSGGRGEEFSKAVIASLKNSLPDLKQIMAESGLHNEGAHRFIERVGFSVISKVFCLNL